MFGNKGLEQENNKLKLEIAELKAELEKERGKNSVLELKLENAKKDAEKAQRYFDTVAEVRSYIDAFLSRRNKSRLECTKQNKIGF